jgi:hypothetical protein
MSESEILRKTLAAPCEKANQCDYATDKCRKPIPYEPDTMRAIPGRRWIDCAGWKLTLNMTFDKRSGSWIYLKRAKIF